ncbi:hypothetical protein TrST_g10784 [Triparma strigata]|uniref:Uncharacterized protein n=1 Tax=Triparma strigata TaxID=1606541 RepID=A0A9W7F226_9STRA|nr:hypothetical protein TrST_g10784 [Triparma strigata]
MFSTVPWWFLAACLICFPPRIGSLSFQTFRINAIPSTSSSSALATSVSSRRNFLAVTTAILPIAAFSAPSVAAYSLDAGEKVKKPSSVPEAYAKFTSARSELSSTIQDYDQITKGGGDNIRRYLGTVGTSSSIFGLKAVLKILQDSADDIGAFVDASEDFDRALVSADSSAYSSMFVEFSAAKGTKEDYYAKALVDIKNMYKCLDIMYNELKELQ